MQKVAIIKLAFRLSGNIKMLFLVGFQLVYGSDTFFVI